MEINFKKMEFCDEFMCSINKKHILREAKKLPCGASACLSCIRQNLARRYNRKIINCKMCYQPHYISNVNDLPSDGAFEEMFANSFQRIHKETCEELEKIIERLKGKEI